ncbi:hypothetical protein EV05_0511 [Prochlorococcus sp. MIT 0601]|nr:hypothetical protein EV05_0511 [Prochlorococcus sp. MIT 0601]
MDKRRVLSAKKFEGRIEGGTCPLQFAITGRQACRLYRTQT